MHNCAQSSMCSSSRTPGMNAMKKKGRWEEEEEDLTKDMEDPPSEPSIQEVQLAKQGMTRFWVCFTFSGKPILLH